jgi:2-polyprenyl-3-methyl-5-hydroxy-6-metoxy-1,4-benzoquinol methylase
VNEIDALENNSFDVITMWHVLEHVPNLEFQIQELKRLLKPTGTLIVAVPNFKSYDAKYYNEFWAAYDVPIHFGISQKKPFNHFLKK